MPEDLLLAIRKFALKNAFDYGKCDPKAIVGKVIGEFPESRKNFADLMAKITNAAVQVNSMPKEEIEKELSTFHFEEKKPEERKLPDLKGAENGKVVMRMAPNPNGPMHIGHCRMAVLNDEYTKRYSGTLILRFDDTDPKNENKIPMKEAYAWMPEDMRWLGVNFHRIERASARLQVYYVYCKKALEGGFAFVCTCKQEGWSESVRHEKKECPCKKNSPEKNLELWNKMLSWELKQGEAVVRVKTDVNEKNPAVVDWPAFRIIDAPEHPMVGKEFKVWPMLDFASAIDDFEFKVTHILRGKDLLVSQERQKILYKYFGWTYPNVTLYGKFLTTDDMVISKSKINAGIREGRFSGFDDPQLSTMKALRRRGILPQAIRNYMLNIGISESETTVDLNILYAENKKLLETSTEHYFFVENPIVLKVRGLQVKNLEIPKHPTNKELGSRRVHFDDEFLISGKDAGEIRLEEVIRLKELANVKIYKQENGKLFGEYAGNDLIKTSKKLHWVSAKFGEQVNSSILFVEKLTETGPLEKVEHKGVCEKACSELKQGQVVQFERMGFCVLDSKDGMKFILSC